jgi:hypothetical protein
LPLFFCNSVNLQIYSRKLVKGYWQNMPVFRQISSRCDPTTSPRCKRLELR